MNTTVYVITTKALDDIDSCVLPDGRVDMLEAFQLMQHRAEEWIDEQATVAAEEGEEPGAYTIVEVSDSEIQIHDAELEDCCPVMTFTLSPVSF